MTVYKAHWHDPDIGCVQKWCASRKAAEAVLRTEAAEYDDPPEPMGIDKVEIPMRKTALIQWLNIYLQTDNG